MYTCGMRGCTLAFRPKQNDDGTPDTPDRTKNADYRLSTEIERTTDPRKIWEEGILDSKVELSLREVAKKEFDDSIVDLVKWKWISTEPESELEKPVEVRMTHLEDILGCIGLGTLRRPLFGSGTSRSRWWL